MLTLIKHKVIINHGSGGGQMNMYERIKKKRIELGMTQDELANKTGFTSRSSISKIESGENDIPQSRIIDFAKALNVSPGYLMGWEKEYEKIDFTNAVEAMKFILEQPSIMAYGGYNLETMSEKEVVDLANDLLYALRLSAERQKRSKE